MSTVLAIALLVAGIVLVVGGAELFFEALLAGASRLRVSAFALAAVVSGFELENLAAGIAANAKGLPGAAAGTFLGGTTFLALGVAGLGGLLAPIRADLPRSVLAWLAASPVPLLALAADGGLSRLDGGLLVAWFAVALTGMARAGRSLLVAEDTAHDPRRWLLRLFAGLGVLTGGGVLLGDGLRRVVNDLGVSQTLLGNTAIAAAVEAEEVGRVAIPAKRGRGDVAIANVAGTIVHFTAFNAGVIALVRPLPLDSASLHLHLPVSVGATLLLCAALLFGHGIGRRSGAAFVALYAAYVATAIAIG
jgi:cation:H+ antiporter